VKNERVFPDLVTPISAAPSVIRARSTPSTYQTVPSGDHSAPKTWKSSE